MEQISELKEENEALKSEVKELSETTEQGGIAAAVEIDELTTKNLDLSSELEQVKGTRLVPSPLLFTISTALMLCRQP